MEDFPLDLVQGQSYRFRFRYSDVVDGVRVPRPLGQMEVRGQARKRGELVLDLTPHFVIEPDGETGAFHLVLSGATTRAITQGGRYDIFISTPGQADDEATRVAKGPLTIEKAQTTSA